MFREGVALWSRDIAADRGRPGPWQTLSADGLEDTTTLAFLGIPLRVGTNGSVEGVFAITADRPRTWGAFEVLLVERLSNALICQIQRTRADAGLLAALVTASDKPIVAVDREGRVTHVNEAAAVVINQNRERLRGTNVADTFYGGDKLLARHAMSALTAAGRKPLRDHYTYLTRYCPEGFELPVPVRLVAQDLVATGGEAVGSVGIFEPLLTRLPERVQAFGDDANYSFTCDPALLRVLEAAADSRDRSALIVGERGSGKELLTRHLRDPSPRAKPEPYERVICGGLDADDLAEELFGCVANWKGRKVRHSGKVSRADGGVLVLDELSEVPIFLQRRLLRVLEDHQAIAMGGDQAERVDVRILAVTSCRREELTDASKFLPDLLNHLDAGSALFVPSFRERRGDVLLAALGYLRHEQTKHDLRPSGFESDAVEVLWQYSWPGGMRELFSQLAAACQRWRSENRGCDPRELRRELVGADHLWLQLVQDAIAMPYGASGAQIPSERELKDRADRRAREKSDRQRLTDERARGRSLFFEVWDERPDLRRAVWREERGAQAAIAKVMAERANGSPKEPAARNLVTEIIGEVMGNKRE